MTPNEKTILQYMMLKGGTVGDTEASNQFALSPAALAIVINALKRHLCIAQHGRYYRVTSVGKDALEQFTNSPRAEPFSGRVAW